MNTNETRQLSQNAQHNAVSAKDKEATRSSAGHFSMESLSHSEQSLFNETMSRLFESGFLWRDEDSERTHFGFVLRNQALFQSFLAALGWSLHHHERLNIIQIIHTRGAHKRRFDKDTTIWILIARLIYAENKEDVKLSLTRNPVCTVGEFVKRYAEHFPGKVFRKKGSLESALSQLESQKLIRPAGARYLMPGNADALIELLPTLEIVVPALKLKNAVEWLEAFAESGAVAPDTEASNN